MTMREAGPSFPAIGRALGAHSVTVSAWWDRCHAGGLGARAPQQRGPKAGPHRRLTARQAQAIQRAITDTTPDHLKPPSAH